MTVMRNTHHRRRLLVAMASLGAMLLAAAPTPAGASTDPHASCVGSITSYEASQLLPGSVGAEVSGLAGSGPGLGITMVSPLAREHGSIGACV
jgi:hypothetical protein